MGIATIVKMTLYQKEGVGIILDDTLGSVGRGMMGSVVVLLHSTGQTGYQQLTGKKHDTAGPQRIHTREKQRSVSTVLCEAREEVPHNSNVNSRWQATIQRTVEVVLAPNAMLIKMLFEGDLHLHFKASCGAFVSINPDSTRKETVVLLY